MSSDMSSDSRATPLVSVVTTAIQSRADDLLVECEASVRAQIGVSCEHLVWMDEAGQGAAWGVNHLAQKAQGEWLLPLADDDLILPRCLEILTSASDGADVVYSPPLVWGNDSWHFFQDPPYIPATALIRRELFLKLGGYEQGIVREEDRSFWWKAYDADATFVKVAEHPTWVYRFHAPDSGHQNKSYHGGVAQ